jgi:hypothetical protein
VTDVSADAVRFLKETYHKLFEKGFIDPSGCLTAAMRIARRAKSSVAPFLKIMVDIVNENPRGFSPNSLLTESVLNAFSLDSLTELLQAMKKCPPPIMTEQVVRILDGPPSPLTCAYFSLLPDGLLRPDMQHMFQFFVDHIEYENSIFWTYWLKFRPFYSLGPPIGMRQFSDRLPVDHIQFLADSFLKIYHKGNTFRQFPILAHSWTLLAAHPPIAALVMQDIHGRLSILNFTRPFFEWCQPALTVASEAEFWSLCSVLCQCSIDENLDESGRVMKSLFVLLTSRFKKTESKVVSGELFASAFVEWGRRLETCCHIYYLSQDSGLISNILCLFIKP